MQSMLMHWMRRRRWRRHRIQLSGSNSSSNVNETNETNLVLVKTTKEPIFFYFSCVRAIFFFAFRSRFSVFKWHILDSMLVKQLFCFLRCYFWLQYNTIQYNNQFKLFIGVLYIGCVRLSYIAVDDWLKLKLIHSH